MSKWRRRAKELIARGANPARAADQAAGGYIVNNIEGWRTHHLLIVGAGTGLCCFERFANRQRLWLWFGRLRFRRGLDEISISQVVDSLYFTATLSEIGQILCELSYIFHHLFACFQHAHIDGFGREIEHNFAQRLDYLRGRQIGLQFRVVDFQPEGRTNSRRRKKPIERRDRK